MRQVIERVVWTMGIGCTAFAAWEIYRHVGPRMRDIIVEWWKNDKIGFITSALVATGFTVGIVVGLIQAITK